MSIFGKLDAANIPTNPYFVEQGEYSAVVTQAYFKTNREDQKQLVIQYTISDEDSQFLDSKVTQYFTLVDSEMTLEAFDLLPGEEKKKIRQSLAKLKRTLCGSDGNSSQKGLGISYDDLNSDEWDPKVLMGISVRLAISNFGNDGVNVKWVNLAE